jgi:hypothetical protein
MALKDKKIDASLKADPVLAEAIRGRLEGGQLPCATAFAIAEEKGVPRLAVGRAADVEQIHLTRCQLGLFGYPNHAPFWETNKVSDAVKPAALDEAILASRDKSGVISCAALMAVADRFGLPKILAGYWADQLGTRVKHCQLGAF